MQTPSGRESSEAWIAQLRELAPGSGELDTSAVFYRAGYAAGRAESGRATMPWWGVLTAACLAGLAFGLAVGLASYRAGYDRGLAMADGGSDPRHANDMIVEQTAETKVAVDNSSADDRPAASASASASAAGAGSPSRPTEAANVKSPSILAGSEREPGAWAWTDWLGLLRNREELAAGGRDATTLTAFHAWTTDNVGPWSLASLEARLVEARSLEDRPDRSPQHRDSRPTGDPARTPRQTLRAGDVGRWTELANQGWINEER